MIISTTTTSSTKHQQQQQKKQQQQTNKHDLIQLFCLYSCCQGGDGEFDILKGFKKRMKVLKRGWGRWIFSFFALYHFFISATPVNWVNACFSSVFFFFSFQSQQFVPFFCNWCLLLLFVCLVFIFTCWFKLWRKCTNQQIGTLFFFLFFLHTPTIKSTSQKFLNFPPVCCTHFNTKRKLANKKMNGRYLKSHFGNSTNKQTRATEMMPEKKDTLTPENLHRKTKKQTTTNTI